MEQSQPIQNYRRLGCGCCTGRADAVGRTDQCVCPIHQDSGHPRRRCSVHLIEPKVLDHALRQTTTPPAPTFCNNCGTTQASTVCSVCKQPKIQSTHDFRDGPLGLKTYPQPVEEYGVDYQGGRIS